MKYIILALVLLLGAVLWWAESADSPRNYTPEIVVEKPVKATPYRHLEDDCKEYTAFRV
jgi:hypothetical protein